MLPIKILAYNIFEHSATKRTPFFINKGFKADVLLEIRKCEEIILYIKIAVKEIY